MASYITSQSAYLQIRAQGLKLALAAQAGSTNARTRWQRQNVRVVIGDKCIARVFTLTNNWQKQAVRKLHRYIFHGMDGDVSLALQHGDFQLLYKQGFAADFRQGRVQYLVTARGDADQFHLQIRIARHQFVTHEFRLP